MDKYIEIMNIVEGKEEAKDFTVDWVLKSKGKQGKPVQAFYNGKLIYTFPSAYFAAQYLDMSAGNIQACCRGRIKGAGLRGRLVWKYLNPEEAMKEPDWGENLNFRQFIRTFTAGPKEFQFYARKVKKGGEIGKILDKFGEDDVMTYTALHYWYDGRVEYLLSLWWGYGYYKWQLSRYEQSYSFCREEPTQAEALDMGKKRALYYLGYARTGNLAKECIPTLSEDDIKHRYLPPSICWGHYPKPSWP